MSAATLVAVALGVLLVASGAGLVVLAARVRQLRERVAELEEREAGVVVEEARSPRAVQAAGLAVRTAVQTVSRVREHGVRGMLLSSIEEFTGWALEARSEIIRVADEDGNVTVFFSDIEGSTALNSEVGDQVWVEVLEAHDRVLEQVVDRHHGHVVKSNGDGHMVVFSSPTLALSAALELQERLSHPRPRALRQHPVKVRIGLHTGTAVERGGDWFGRNVAKAARVASLAEGGEVLVSTELAARLREQVGESADWTLRPTETVTLKGLPGEHTLWLVEAR
ncbi:adenylate/guanylate cyclase domain-containing protein [Nocardioides scoriae]|uniref:adenylate/guanylate cyclase domain-containing protein n=1 Tax=Nocardioides scoriae TaxID=642780 RepID=UPI000B862B93|nr:adenylate/guanylate cyclase domain-containing protein [Nocardioides scoriae]